MIDPMRAWDVWSAGISGAERLAERQTHRFQDLCAHARRYSPFYREHLRGIGDRPAALAEIPPVSKTQLMRAFDRWGTERELTYARVEAFAEDRGRIGELLDGRWAVWRTSGTSGEMGLFVHDRFALDVYDALFALRAWPTIASPAAVTSLVGHGYRMACVMAKEDHFAGIATWRHQAYAYPWLAPVMRDFSVMTPLPELVLELNAWDPGQLVAYPSVLSLLAEEQAAGRLRISPGIVIAGGETLELAEKHRVEHAFNAAVLNVYACSEADYIGFGCSHGWLHVNADWMILEPVDRAYQPVSPGTPSHTVLLTNLANRTQPVIRYDLHDSVTVKPGSCPCGSPFAAIAVEGRRNELLRFQLTDEREVKVLPMAIGTAVEGVVGLRQYQLVQTGPAEVTLRCSARTGADPAIVGHAAVAEVVAYLAQQGAGNVDVSLSDQPPQADARSGKFHCIMASPGMSG